MKRSILIGMAITAILFATSTATFAKSAAKMKATPVMANDNENADSVKSLKWENVRTYKAVRVKLTDKAGNPILNEDGTQATRVLLSDDRGAYKGWEAVHQQYRELDKAVTRIIAKVGGGAVLGAVVGGLLSGDWKGAVGGAVAGAGAGALLSKNDIKNAKALKKAMKQQKKELELYHQTFTDEGRPISASANLSHFENIEERTAVDSDIDAELASADFNTPDLSWKL